MTMRRAYIPGPFLGNGSENTLPQQQALMQPCGCVVCGKMLYARDKVTAGSSVWESVKKGLELEAEE
jgi:hypothetical protein